MFKKVLIITILSVFILSCSNNNKHHQTDKLLSTGHWVFKLNIGKDVIPFDVAISVVDSHYVFEIINADEKIKYIDSSLVSIKHKNIKIVDPIFESWFELKILSNNKLQGFWYKGKDYKIPVIGLFNKQRFYIKNKIVPKNINGKWKTIFSPHTTDEYKAIGIFKQSGNTVVGTFATEYGDYRFLEGIMDGDSLKLSTFDGSHAFLFKAKLYNDTLKGMFYSGNHWQEKWIAVKNDTFELRNPEELTYLNEGYDKIEFSLPDLDSNIVTFPSEKFNDKVVIINIMGTWCPNCKDEVIYLSDLHNRYKDLGLEVISVAFERNNTFKENVASVKKEKAFSESTHLFLIGGKASKVEASKVFPMLNQIVSFPTSIFIDKKGKVRKIRTGFYGPATGKYYIEYCNRTEQFIQKLLKEK